MKCIKLIIASVIIFGITACSTMSIDRQAATLSAIKANRTYHLRVRSGNLELDKLIHEYASARFGKYLQLSNNNDFSGYIEIVFSSALKGTRAGYTTNIIYGDAWYSGDEKSFLNSINPATPPEIARDGIFAWQNSVMNVTIKDISGKIFWSARYNYKGATDKSVFLVHTADEAARITIDRIVRQFEEDFIIIPPAAANTASDKKPSIALIIKSPEPAAPQENPVQP